MELNQIKCFLALAETLNFTRAAEQCGITQPSLSKAIRKLEAEMGGPLITRERGRTHLTELGGMLLPRLKQAFSLTQSAKDAALHFSRDAASRLRMGVMSTIGPRRLVPYIGHLAKGVPEIDLTVHEASGPDLLDMLWHGEIDMALMDLPEYPSEIEAVALYSENAVVSFAAGHRFSDQHSVPLQAFEGEDYLHRRRSGEATVTPAKALQRWEKSKIADSQSLIPEQAKIRFSSENDAWIQAMALAGLGSALIPEFSIVPEGLDTRPVAAPELSRVISLVRIEDRPAPQSVELAVQISQAMTWV